MNREKKKRKDKRRKSFTTIILVVIMLIGLSVLLYPTLSDYWNSFHQSRAIASYDTAVEQLDETDYEALFAQAETYNEHLKSLYFPFSQYDQLEEEYLEALDITGTGIIGYVSISKIGIELPIYHGTSDEVLNKASGHLEGSTLPIGGESTHAVISAHRGLPSAKLFTNLDELEVGDTFTVTVLNQTLTYEVDQILIIEPTQLEALNVVQGEDHVTLLTCTPYGINTQRLLVRGKRIENVQTTVIHSNANKIPVYIVMPAVMIPMLFVLLVLLLIKYRRKPKKRNLDDYIIKCDDDEK